MMVQMIAYRLDPDGKIHKEDRLRIRRALDAAGYNEEPATEEALRGCFRDLVDSGYWNNVEIEDLDDYSVNDICRNLIKRSK